MPSKGLQRTTSGPQAGSEGGCALPRATAPTLLDIALCLARALHPHGVHMQAVSPFLFNPVRGSKPKIPVVRRDGKSLHIRSRSLHNGRSNYDESDCYRDGDLQRSILSVLQKQGGVVARVRCDSTTRTSVYPVRRRSKCD